MWVGFSSLAALNDRPAVAKCNVTVFRCLQLTNRKGHFSYPFALSCLRHEIAFMAGGFVASNIDVGMLLRCDERSQNC